MEIAESAFLVIVNRFCSWIPYRAKLPSMSRDFWMSDESCRVCYECDFPFTLFNRRHHCRVCGRIFCGKCTLNTLPAAESCPGIYEDGEHVRVCNFCFKIKQEESKKQEEERAAKLANPTITPSSSSFSLASSSISSSSTSSSSSSSVNPGETLAPYGYRSSATTRVDLNLDKKQRRTVRTGRSSLRTFSPRGREVSPNPYDFCSNRSDEDETDDHKDAIYKKRRVFEIQSQDEEEDDSCIEVDASESHTKFSQDPVYDMIKTDNIDENEHSEDKNLKPNCRSTVRRSLSKRSIMFSDDYYGPEESMDESNLYTPSLIQDAPSAGVEVLDVENSDSLWIPPPPEDEEGEMGICLVDDDDDNESGWGSLSSSDYRSRERAAVRNRGRLCVLLWMDILGHW